MRGKFLTSVLVCAILSSLFVFAAPERVAACSCAGPPTTEEQLERKTAIFAGKVERIEKPERIRSSADAVKVAMRVSRVWKGSVGKTVTVRTAVSSVSCGYDRFVEGEAYIIYANGEPDRLETGICEGTKPLTGAQADLAALGDGLAPKPGVEDPVVTKPPAPDDDESLGDMTLLLGAVAVVLVVGFFLIAGRGHKR